MAAASESNYFPPLDKCLAGTERLISWRVANRSVDHQDDAIRDTPLHRFLQSDEAKNILRNALNPFSPPSPATKTEFETKTAPIHVAQATAGEYNLEEIKLDALWLSNEVQVGELHALRIAVIEWQERSADQLLANFAGPQNSTVANQDFNYSLTQSTANFLASTNGAAKAAPHASSEDSRRERLLRIFLEERENILMMHVDVGVQNDFRNDSAGPEAWVDCHECIRFIREECSEDAKKREPEIFKTNHARRGLLFESKIRRLTQVLRALLSRTYAAQKPSQARLVREWFELMEEVMFLQDPQNFMLDQGLSPISCLVSLVSLSMLSLPPVLAQLDELLSAFGRDGARYPDVDGNESSDYFLTDACISQVSKTLDKAVFFKISVASPAVYAWTFITTRMRELATTQQRARERPQIQEAHSTRTRREPPSSQVIGWERRFKAVEDSMDPGDSQDDPPLYFAQAAVDKMNVYALVVALGHVTTNLWDSKERPGTAFESRFTLFGLLRESLTVVPYSADVLEAVLSVFGSEHDSASESDMPFSHLLAKTFLDDDEYFMPRVLTQALLRYPYELSPMIRLLTKLASASARNLNGPPVVVKILDELERLTVMVPVNFRAYRLEAEDEGSNEMLLTNDLAIFRHRKATLGSSSQRAIRNGSGDNRSRAVVSVPAGTSGVIVKEDPPRVLSLSHPHSGLQYFGLLLATRLPNSEFVPASVESDIDRATAAEVINLINTILLACMRQNDGEDQAKIVLEQLSHELAVHGQQGIVPVISDTFEMELLAHLDQAPEDGSLDLAIACAEFFNVLSQISPEKVWAVLSRSSLLGANGGASALAAVVGGTEVPLGQYRFLASCVRLHSKLLNDAVSGLVERKIQFRKAANRFDTTTERTDLTPERAMKAVLISYQKVMMDAFQDLRGLKFASPREKQEISTILMASFATTLRWTYGLADPASDEGKAGQEQKEKISAVLTRPAEMLLQAFASEEDVNPLVSALGDLFSSGLDAANNDLSPQLRASLIRQIQTTCNFTTALVGAARRKVPTSATKIGTALLRGMNVFATLYAADSAYKAPLSTLLGELVQAVSGEEAEPISLLAPLSPEGSKDFLALISELDRPFCDEGVEAKMWDFLATVLGGRQQWFAIYLLTGALPKTRTKDSTNSGTAKAKSLLMLALDELTDITKLSPERAKAMLKFVAVAQNVWIWATNDIRSKSAFLQNAVQFLETLLQNKPRSTTTSDALVANELQMAALLCDIFAVNLHAGLETGDKSLLTLLKDHMSFFIQRAALTESYNRSLHTSLAKNLKEKYPQCDLADFKRSVANPANYGEEFFYDLELAAEVLDHNPAWKGTSRERNGGRGYIDEFRRANINLSVVHAEMNLLISWKKLASTLCECVDQEKSLQASLAQAAASCLNASADANLDVPGTAAVLQTRAELAFGIMSKLVLIKSTDPTMNELLPAAWDLVSSAPVDYEVASAQEDLQYYRLLLQILYLAIQPFTYMIPDAKFRPAREANATEEDGLYLLQPATGNILVEIVRKIVAPGFRALCGNLHGNIQMALPGDFALLTGLVQAMLSAYGVTTVHQQIAEVVSISGIVRGALSLFSWSDRLAEMMDGDPVYGEVSMTFILALSSMPAVAEQMAVDGVLLQLANANISNYFRKPGGKGPFDEPRRMFNIWNQGFLPLCLNLLDAVGAPMAAEVTEFLNGFDPQLRRAETALLPTVPTPGKPRAGDVTLGLATEAHTLLVIGRILESDVARGAADGVNAAEIPLFDLNLADIKGNVAALPRTTRSLADKIVATNEREAIWAMTSVTGASDNLLAQKVQREMIEAGAVYGPVDA